MCNRNRMFFLSAFLQFFVVSRALQLKKALLCFKYAQMCRHLTHIFRYVVCYVISTLCVVYDKLFFYSFSLNLLVCACLCPHLMGLIRQTIQQMNDDIANFRMERYFSLFFQSFQIFDSWIVCLDFDLSRCHHRTTIIHTIITQSHTCTYSKSKS